VKLKRKFSLKNFIADEKGLLALPTSYDPNFGIRHNSLASEISGEEVTDENEYKMAILLELIHKNRGKMSIEDQDLFKKIKHSDLLSTTNNDSVAPKFKNLII